MSESLFSRALLKRDSNTGVFLGNLQKNFINIFFHRTSPMVAFVVINRNKTLLLLTLSEMEIPMLWKPISFQDVCDPLDYLVVTMTFPVMVR